MGRLHLDMLSAILTGDFANFIRLRPASAQVLLPRNSILWGSCIGVTKGDTRSLGHSSE